LGKKVNQSYLSVTSLESVADSTTFISYDCYESPSLPESVCFEILVSAAYLDLINTTEND